jgi:3-hydroxyacyl-[acyl-carrier-protein] dehydratase
MKTIDRPIVELLPHRDPILLVDAVLRYEPPHLLVTTRDICVAELCYARRPHPRAAELAYPPTLLIESYVQSCALLFQLDAQECGRDNEGVLMLGAVRDVALLRSVFPGQTVRHEVRLEHTHGTNALLAGASYVGDSPIMTIGAVMAVIRPRSAMAARVGRVRYVPDRLEVP